MRKLIFASGNPHKVEEAAAVLGDAFRIITPAEAGLSGEIPETGNTLRSNSLQKARYIYEHTGADCFCLRFCNVTYIRRMRRGNLHALVNIFISGQ